MEHETPISLSSSVFNNVDKSICILYVPYGCKSTYENAEVWKDFQNIIEYEPDTDLSAYDNVVYIEGTEALVGQQVRLSLKMNNTLAITAFQCDVYLPNGVTAAKNENGRYQMDVSSERNTTGQIDYSKCTYLQSDDCLRFLCYSSENYTFSDNEGEVAYLIVDIDPNIEEGTYPLILKNIEITDGNLNAHLVTYVKTTLTVSSYTIGDANNDGRVSVTDLTAIVSHIMGTTPANFIEKAADVNSDGRISVTDLTGVVNIILHGSEAATAKTRNDAATKYTIINGNDVTASTNEEFIVAVNISGNYAYSGYQFDITLPEGLKVKDVSGQTTSSDLFNSRLIGDNTLRVLCLSTTGETSEGSVVNLTLLADHEGTYNIDIDNAIVSANASEYTMSKSSFLVDIDSEATGISTLGDEASGNAVVYDLTGKKLMGNGNISSLQKGIYIVNGKKVTK